ncbi:hypothetical protein QJS66_04565 [Kocuria rhizophila]|nr:hypothetical protein QJS66_04565 [Kocuria rhizophila]
MLALGFAVAGWRWRARARARPRGGRRPAGWPVSRIVLTLIGWAHGIRRVHTRALPTALVSLVGPLSNVAVALLGEVMTCAPATAARPGWALLQLLVLANWVLGLLDLLPACRWTVGA